MNLLVDIGNSSIKWATLSGGKFMPGGREFHEHDGLTEVLARSWSGMAVPESVLVANVAGESAAGQIGQRILQQWGIAPRFVQTERRSSGGLVNGYEHPEQMGVDRWLALSAAWSRHHGAGCVVDCGTALTIDAVDQKGRHLGGLIMPGLGLLRSTLSNNAAGIPPVQPEEWDGELGRSTDECVGLGTLAAAVAMIERTVARLRDNNEMQLYCVITGGDGPVIAKHLGSEYEYDPDLVLRGLAELAGDGR